MGSLFVGARLIRVARTENHEAGYEQQDNACDRVIRKPHLKHVKAVERRVGNLISCAHVARIVMNPMVTNVDGGMSGNEKEGQGEISQQEMNVFFNARLCKWPPQHLYASGKCRRDLCGVVGDNR